MFSTFLEGKEGGRRTDRSKVRKRREKKRGMEKEQQKGKKRREGKRKKNANGRLL